MEPVPTSRHVCIIGLMGVGKSTVAALVGSRLDRPVLDSDPWIEDRYGETGRQIAEREGVTALHAIEASMLERALSIEEPSVITPAASVVVDAVSRGLLAQHALVVWLDLDAVTAFQRSRSGSHRRHTTLADFERMVRERRDAFVAASDLRLDARQTPDALAESIVTAVQSSSSS